MRTEHASPAFAAAAALILAGLLMSGAAAQDAPPRRLGNGADPGIGDPAPAGPQSPEPQLSDPPADEEPQAQDEGAEPPSPPQAPFAQASPAPGAPDLKSPPPAAQKKAPPPAPKDAAPKDKETMLAELYAHLAKATDGEQAAEISKTIEGLWLHSGSDTVGVLMRRGLQAVNQQRNDLALKMFDAVVNLAPDYAEGWSRRAFVYYLQNDTEHAVGDLRRALALDPNHYKALDGLARILRDSGQKKSALRAYQQLLRINPYAAGAKEAESALSVEVEGQGI